MFLKWSKQDWVVFELEERRNTFQVADKLHDTGKEGKVALGITGQVCRAKLKEVLIVCFCCLTLKRQLILHMRIIFPLHTERCPAWENSRTM